jgi:phage major head subunit gpT-like protein
MPSIITAPLLGAINNGLNLSFNSQLYAAPTVYRSFCYDATSTGRDEIYPVLDTIAGPREWLGARVAQQLSAHTFTIKNKKFEQTIAIKRDEVEDDKYGIYTPIAQELGLSAAHFPEILVANLMKSGNATAGYDGQNFFDVAHPNWDATGAAITLGNYTAGSNPGWFLVDNSRALKPFVFQTRIPFNLIARFNEADPSVFDNDEFLWGTRGRMNAGFGLWQLAYYSKAAFTQANLLAARTAMAAIRRPDGTPMGISADTVIVPTTLLAQANSYFSNGLVANDPSTPTVLVESMVRGLFKPVEFKWLN